MFRFGFPGFAETVWILPKGVAHDLPEYEPMAPLFAVHDLESWAERQECHRALDELYVASFGEPWRTDIASPLRAQIGRLRAAFEAGELVAWCLRRTSVGEPAALPLLGPGPALPRPTPRPDTTIVNPVLSPKRLVVVVRKFARDPSGGAPIPYTAPSRQSLELKTDSPFDGTGTFTVTGGGKVKFFTAVTGGTEIPLPSVFAPGASPPWAGSATLTGGVTVFVEGISPSAALDDITAQLALSGGSKPVGPPAKSTITSVELTLDICKSRTAAQTGATPPGDPDPMSGDDKINVGRFLHQQDAQLDHGRALLIVQKVKPAAFTGDLELANLDPRVALFASDAPTPAIPPDVGAGGPALGTQTVPTAGLPRRFWAEGASVSGALVDTSFRLGIKGGEPDGDRVRCTVVQFTKITATIKPTPPTSLQNTSDTGFLLPADHVFTTSSGSEAFASGSGSPPLVLMRNAQPDIELELTAAPSNLPIVWGALRNPLDAAAIGGAGDLPTLTPAANKLEARFAADQVGSFRIRPFIDCNGSGTHEDREPSIPLLLVLVDGVVVGEDRSAALTAANPLLLDDDSFSFVSGNFETTPFTVDKTSAAMTVDLDVDLVGGGPDGKLGLDHVFGGVVQSFDDWEYAGSYAGPAPGSAFGTVKYVLVSNGSAASGVIQKMGTFLPPKGAPKGLASPVLDGNKGVGGDSATTPNGFSRMRQRLTQPALGMGVQIWFIDSPRDIRLPRYHPAGPKAVLAKVHLDMRFRACVLFWTNIDVSWPDSTNVVSGNTGAVAERVYSVIRISSWRLAGQWSITSPFSANAPISATAESAYVAEITSQETITPIGRAQDHNCVVRGPVTSASRAFDATEFSAAPGGGCQVQCSAAPLACFPMALALVVMALVVRRRASRAPRPSP